MCFPPATQQLRMEVRIYNICVSAEQLETHGYDRIFPRSRASWSSGLYFIYVYVENLLMVTLEG